MVAITTAAASAPLMKNRAISTTQSAELRPGTGSASRAVNSDSSGVARDADDVGVAAALQLDAGAADDGEPEEPEAGRRRHDAEHELADRATA